MRILPSTVILLLAYQTVFAAPAQPFLTRDQNPLLLVYGLPAASAARLPEHGTWQTDWTANLSNTLNIQTAENESLIIDGEIYQTMLHAEYGVADNWSIGVQAGWLTHTGGFMDQSIETYHDWFGLPQGDRTGQPHDRLLYRYTRNGVEALQLNNTDSGVSDMQLTTAYCLQQSPQRDYSVHASLKLPTGDPSRMTGSGAADVSVWLSGRETIGDNWQTFGNAGVLIPGKGDILPDQQQNKVWFSNLGLQWQFWSSVALKLQFEWHSSFYSDSALRFMGDATQLTTGGSWQISPGLAFDVALTEDIKVEESPDVTFHFALRFSY